MGKRKKRKHKRAKRSTSSPKKVSEMINDFAADFIDMGEGLEQKRVHLNIAAFAWNLSLLKGVERDKQFDKSMKMLREQNQNLNESDLDDVRNDINKLIANKESLFPHIKKLIVSVDMQLLENGDYYITAASTDIS